MNKIKCDECRYGIDVNQNGKVKLCDPPKGHKMYKPKPVKHGIKFTCGYGVCWKQEA